MRNSVLLGSIIAILCVALAIGQGLFPLFQAFQPQTPAASLPPKQPKGRSPNDKLRACCAKVN